MTEETLRWPEGLSMAIEGAELSTETLRILVGMDPAKHEAPGESAFVVTTVHERPPMDPPRKARRLTGKRYRIARRRYARTMKAWRRGLIKGREVYTTMYAVPTEMRPVPGRNAVSVGFRGVALRGSWPDAAP